MTMEKGLYVKPKSKKRQKNTSGYSSSKEISTNRSNVRSY